MKRLSNSEGKFYENWRDFTGGPKQRNLWGICTLQYLRRDIIFVISVFLLACLFIYVDMQPKLGNSGEIDANDIVNGIYFLESHIKQQFVTKFEEIDLIWVTKTSQNTTKSVKIWAVNEKKITKSVKILRRNENYNEKKKVLFLYKKIKFTFFLQYQLLFPNHRYEPLPKNRVSQTHIVQLLVI